VLDRFFQSLKGQPTDYVVRLTSDCPLIDAQLIDKVIDQTISQNLDYCSNTLDPHYPDGQDIEVFRYSALKKAWTDAALPSEREHVTPYIWKNSTYKGGTMFVSGNFNENYSYGHLRMTVDEPRDFEVITRLIKDLGHNKTWLDYAKHLENNQEIKSITADIKRNEGYDKSINKEN
jgi:spore coat polysaccharide biosynthesis protein SpsF (cytidylyltransferase family)